ncbi:F-box/FBD/LRR-repeat protein At1g13570-like [Rutidosis leptorrhynchoides]|uniref:F-box/FBD/LRR-repeat protein At1g13570-like n=1 Tax=Rutidosis leptorrhynchoides TaxID=125765 RepID=UPI003A999FD2
MESTSSVSTCEASKFAVEDVINTMLSNVVSCILDFLPLQDAVRTSILSRNWRYKWTMINQVVFDNDFFEYIMRTKGDVDGRIITRVLVYHEGSITKFVLDIPRHKRFDDDDIYLWAKLLSTKSVKEIVIVNKNITPIVLPTLLFSCVDLKHLKLCRCCFHVNAAAAAASLGCFPKLLSLEFDLVNSWELVIGSDIFQLVGFLPKLHRLTLDLHNCSRFMVDAAAAGNLKVLQVLDLDYDNCAMVSFFFDLIQGSPNLEILRIRAINKDRVFPSPVTLDQVKAGITGYLQQLRNVDFVYLKDSHV